MRFSPSIATIRFGRQALAILALGIILSPATIASRTDTLYEALGERDGISRLVDSFLLQIASDERISHRFVETNIKRFRRMLNMQFCAVTDGPCIYDGDDMRKTHAGLSIREAEFNAVVECLMDAMDENEIAIGVQNRLLTRFARMQRDIVAY